MKKYYLRFVFLFIVIFIMAFASIAQNQFLIHGVIKDQVTQVPVNGVNVQIQNTNIGTSTDKQGVFELRVSTFPAELVITHVSYGEKKVVVNQIQVDSVCILLNPVTVDLSEAVISSKAYKNLKGTEVIDYDFFESNIIILSYNFTKKHHELILTDEKLDTINSRVLSYLKKPNQIFKDCMGNCHLLTEDSAYQINIFNESIQLIYPTYLPKFLKILENCLFDTPTYFAFKGNTDKKLKLEYVAIGIGDMPLTRSKNDSWKHLFYFVNKKTNETIILDQIYEWEKYRDAYEQAVFMFNAPENKLSFGDLLRFEEKFISKPSFQTLKILHDTIYYFNHLKSCIDIYSSNLVLLKSLKVEYQNEKHWLPIILSDAIENKAYTIFKKGPKLSIAAINLFDGSVKELTVITKLFPQKIKINNGKLYFLYKNMSIERDKRILHFGELSNL